MLKDSPIPYIYTICEEEVQEARLKYDEVYDNMSRAYIDGSQKSESGFRAASNYRQYSEEALAEGKEAENQAYEDMSSINKLIKTAENYSKEVEEWERISAEYRDLSQEYALRSKSWAIEENEKNSKYWSQIAKQWANGVTDSSKFWAENGVQYVDPSQDAKDDTSKYSKIKIPEFELDFETMTLYQVNYESSDKYKFSIEDGKIYYELVA